MRRQHVLYTRQIVSRGGTVPSQGSISALEAADRLAIRKLTDAYAHCVRALY